MKEPIGSDPLTIGRAAGNTLRLLDPEISRKHCRIEWRDGNLYATDLSKNGMLINGDLKKEAEINAGDRISIGPWTLLIDTTIDAVPIKTLASTPHLTRVISYDPSHKCLTTERIEIIVNSPDQAPTKKCMTKSEITLGHHASCDVAVADPYVSRRHCRLEIKGREVRLIDLASTNGVFVGDTKINQVSMQPHGVFRIGRSVVNYRLVSETESIVPSKSSRLGNMLGASKSMREIFALISRIAPSDSTVVITGESGTGKELAAREIHRLSNRNKQPFVAVNCGAIPSTIIESQLFGHERGAFTGAVERATGFFEQARSGTLFLDEIGEMPLDLQTRLLRVLESKTVRRLGGQEEIPVDFRLVCATNKNLGRMARQKTFREDLLFRIFVIPIEISPLRERPEDIPALAKHFVSEFAPKGRSLSLTDAALTALSDHKWAGNARELRNTIERTLLLCDHDVIEATDLNFATLGTQQDDNGSLKDQERAHLIEALRECKGNLSRASRKLGIARTTLSTKMRKHKIQVPK
ncbi:MAG: sigma 54-interacting transcriptional regulator [Pseudomonadota bacterium]